MNLKTLISIGFCIATLTACKPDLRTIGTVDDDKLITPKTLADMGYTAFREKYFGQEVTVTGFYQSGLIGTYRKNEAQCEVAFSTKDKNSGKKFNIYIYTNHFPDFVIKDVMKRHDNFDPKYLHYDQEVTLPDEICDEWCEYDSKTKACFYKSPDLKITGKIFELVGDERSPVGMLYMKVKGVEY
ncbi:hypothetical protein [Gynuella sunshinyii]|uniref:Lipoprotein n=1 Tax=Gynuella sunshinyii YC6258 TaxID=1445510 RepID=A0A0C5VL30_9GAMM|nr:hypothetical protein [Gynuella sunshinyii]AJQ94083.1 hypothetical Protein YC6258_02039 [Gynuella sunshinyii YC6258]